MQINSQNKVSTKTDLNITNVISKVRKYLREISRNNSEFIKHYNTLFKSNKNLDKKDFLEIILQHLVYKAIGKKINKELQLAIEIDNVCNSLIDKEYFSELSSTLKLVLSNSKNGSSDIAPLDTMIKVLYQKSFSNNEHYYFSESLNNFIVKNISNLYYKHFDIDIFKSEIKVLDNYSGLGEFLDIYIKFLLKTSKKKQVEKNVFFNSNNTISYYQTFELVTKLLNKKKLKNNALIDPLDLDYETIRVGKQISLFNQPNENQINIEQQSKENFSVIFNNYFSSKAFSENKNDHEYFDMFSWSYNRLAKQGITVFITPRSFIYGNSYKVKRKWLHENFSNIFIIDIVDHDLSEGFALSFCIKENTNNEHAVYYSKIEKPLQFNFKDKDLHDINFKNINLVRGNLYFNDNDFYEFPGLIQEKESDNSNYLFNKNFSALSCIDDKNYAVFDKSLLENNVSSFFSEYNENLNSGKDVQELKWNKKVKELYKQKHEFKFDSSLISQVIIFPYYKGYIYTEPLFINQLRENQSIYGDKLDKEIPTISINTKDEFSVYCSLEPCINPIKSKEIIIPLFYHDNKGKRINNISDKTLKLFRSHYTKQVDKSTLSIKNQSQEIEIALSVMSKSCRKYPVLYKLFSEINLLINNFFKEVYSLENANNVSESINALEKKAFQLGRDAKDRKKLFSDLKAQIQILKSEINKATSSQKAKLKEQKALANISGEDIFYYTYAVLYYKDYLNNYHYNLRDSLPRIPFYENFFKWVSSGKSLFELQSGKKTMSESPLTIEELTSKEKAKSYKITINKKENFLLINDLKVSGIPNGFWLFKLNHYSVVNILKSLYKNLKEEKLKKTDKDPEEIYFKIQEKIVNLLKKYITLYIETNKVINEINDY